MATLVEQICAVLASGPPLEQQDALSLSRNLIEKSSGRPECGWDRRAVAECIDETTIPRLREALIRFIERHLDAPPVASAIGVLAELRDATLKPLFTAIVDAAPQPARV